MDGEDDIHPINRSHAEIIEGIRHQADADKLELQDAIKVSKCY